MYQVRIDLPAVESRQELLDYLEWIVDHVTDEKMAEYSEMQPYSSTLYQPGKSKAVGKIRIAPETARALR